MGGGHCILPLVSELAQYPGQPLACHPLHPSTPPAPCLWVHSAVVPLGWFRIGIETLGVKQTLALFLCLLEVEDTCPSRVLLLPQP